MVPKLLPLLTLIFCTLVSVANAIASANTTAAIVKPLVIFLLATAVVYWDAVNSVLDKVIRVT